MRYAIQNIVALSLSLACSLFLAELGLRLLGDSPGITPVAYEPAKFFYKEPFKEDEKLGWSLRPGRYTIMQDGRAEPVRIEVNRDGSRITSSRDVLWQKASEQNTTDKHILPGNIGEESQVVLVGDSYMFGHGLHNEETLGWQLQARLPDVRVINFGVGGYSTCQVLAQVKEISSNISTGAKIIYGLSSFHAQRNMADPRSDYWMAMTSPNHSSQYPFCSLKKTLSNIEPSLSKEEGGIELHAARTWSPLVPFTGELAISRRITNAYLSFLAEGREKQRELTIELMEKLKGVLSQRGAELWVLWQDIDPEDDSFYRRALLNRGIRIIDGGGDVVEVTSRLSDGHPGPKMNWHWAKIIEGVLLNNA